MRTLLTGDIGGTKTLLSLQADGEGAPQELVSHRYPSADWADLDNLVRHFLAEADVAALPAPQAACFAVAGPVQGGEARLTNLPWRLSEAGLAAATGIGSVALVNDFAVLVHGLPHLAAEQWAPVRGGSGRPDGPLLVVGAGTGLGVALGVPGPSGAPIALASEGGHGGFVARSEAEWELLRWLRHDLGLERISVERIVSGTGLGHVARWLMAVRPGGASHPLADLATAWSRAIGGPPPRGAGGAAESAAETAESGADPAETGGERPDLPAAVAAAAAAGDGLAREALDLWLAAYGAAVGDLALSCLPTGGIWLAGGTASRLLAELRGPLFSEAFLAKGRLRPTLEPLPIRAALDPQLGTFSAAWRARSLLG